MNLEQKNNKIIKNKPQLSWLPSYLIDDYNRTDLLYSKCLEIFGQLEASMRDDIPETTMRQWFIEFVRNGWTQEMVNKRYNKLIRNKKYGGITFADWVNASAVYGEDELKILVSRIIEQNIAKGRMLINNIDNLDDLIIANELKSIELSIIKELEYYYKLRANQIRESIKDIVINKLYKERT